MATPTTIIAIKIAIDIGMKYRSAMDGAAEATGAAVGAGLPAVKNASSYDA
jgi:hypothetical protein